MASTATASLGMYDLPGLRPDVDAFWQAVATRLAKAGIDGVPAALDRTRPLTALWRDPDLLLAQTCGAPYVRELSDIVRPVALPRYDAPGCEPAAGATPGPAAPVYRSAVVVAAAAPIAGPADLAGRRLAINDPGSHSGTFALRALLAAQARHPGDPVAGRVLETGSHAASLAAVAGGRADAAAIDAVTLALLADAGDPAVAAVRVIAWTAPAPTLPFVTAASRSDATVAILAEALAGAVGDPALRPACRRLRLAGIAPATPERFDETRALIAEAGRLGPWTPHAMEANEGR